MIEIDMLELDFEEKAENAIAQYNSNLARIQVGAANPKILDGVKMDYYETMTPISQLASISIPEPRQLLIKPFDMNITKEMVAAINHAHLGVEAVNEGDKARITFPIVTTERRKELVKSLSKYTEQARVSIRQARQDSNKQIKSDDDLSDDDKKTFETEVQNWTNKWIDVIEKELKLKENDLMKI